ncbi:MAG TPA: proton-conducting transporter membrane subunit, partial [Myxococcales bacterium]|nr:proton-conducting transporter membrane subunit [Myxococcales bacterium]
MNAYLLSLIIFTPLLGAVLITASLALPMQKAAREQLSRYIALGGSAIPFVLGIYLWVAYKGSGGPGMGSLWSPPQYVERFVWIPSLNIEYFVGVDGISVSMVILSTLISMIACIASMPWWKRADEHEDPHHPHFSTVKVPGYMAMLLLLETGMSGTFASMDMFLFFVFWEVMLLPMYFLIGIWGGPRKEYAAIKFFLYTLAGSVLLLLAIIALYYRSGDQQLLAQLAQQNRVGWTDLVGGPNHVLTQGPNGQWGYL